MRKVLIERNEACEEILLCIDALQQQVNKMGNEISVLAKKLANLEFHNNEEDDQPPAPI